MSNSDEYRLDDQIGFVLRRASQRHTSIFAARMVSGLTPTQFAVLAKLHEMGALAQNELGRRTAMDGATVKGVVDRLRRRGLVVTRRDSQDGRRNLVELSPEGKAVVKKAIPVAAQITAETLNGLSEDDRLRIVDLLARIS